MLKKYLFPLFVFLLCTSHVWGTTLYFNGAQNGNWSTLGNWWQDSGFTTPAVAVPSPWTDVVISATVSSRTSGSIPVVSNMQVYGSSNIGITVIISQTATFNDTSYVTGVVQGNSSTVTFNDSSRNRGSVFGTAVFNDTSFNDTGNIYNAATFNDNSYHSSGIVYGAGTFNDNSHNASNVYSLATFNDNSYNTGTIDDNANVYYPSPNPIGGTVTGIVTYYNYDTTGPVISETTPLTPTADTTPNYTFISDEAGTISYGGSCTSATTSASSGANTITFNALAEGTYSDCTITVTDAATNASNVLSVSTFTINTSIQSWTSSPTAWVGTPSTTTLETAPTQPVVEIPIQTPAPTENNPVADVPATPTTDIGSSIAIPVNNTFGSPSEQPTSVLSLNINLSPRRNSPEDVMRLQEFLNLYEGETLVVTGIYDWGTQEAVKRFQVKYASEILRPLGLTEPTGNVGIFTRTKINSMIARDSLEPAPFRVNITPQRNNNPGDVVRLQDFLNTHEGESLILTGIYDWGTQEAVKRFQVKYASEILRPLGLRNPTVNVGIFMRAKINGMIVAGE